jgi:anti-sigma factor RsiW
MLLDYALRRLSAAETTAVASHLEHCAECRAILLEEEATGRVLDAVPLAAPRRDLWTSVLARRDEVLAPRPSLLARLRPLLAPLPAARLAMAPALAIGLALLLVSSPFRQKPAATAAAEAVTVISAVRQASVESDDPLGDFHDRTWDALAAQGRS